MLLKARQAQLIHQAPQLGLVAGPKPGWPQVNTVNTVNTVDASCTCRCPGCRWSRCSNGRNAPAKPIAGFQQHIVFDALLLQ